MRRIASWLLTLGVAVVACSGKDEAVGGDGRGDDACFNYRDALCDWVVRCNPGLKYDDCQATAGAIECATDGRAEACTEAIDLANCAEPPDDCELFDVADREPAAAACVQYEHAVCDAYDSCGEQPYDECLTEVAGALDCGTVIGVRAGLDACLADLAAPECGGLPPPSCSNVLLSEPTL